ncbi:MAG: ubiquitin-like domain-containing protein, partial [Anaerolineales bacterium]|nr:ubiquitin-like domain-containing protein [Anaerolineales bacterium]
MNIRDLTKNPLLQKITALTAAVLGILLIFLSLHKTVILVINGEPREITTSKLSVKGVLKSQGFDLTDEERLSPDSGTLLWGGERIFLDISSPIEILADGDRITIQTAEQRPENIILDAGLLLYPKDRLLVDGALHIKNKTLSPGEPHQIQLLRGTPITLQLDDDRLDFISDADFLADAFESEDIEIFEADQLSRPLDTKLDGSPITVTLIRAKPLLVYLADESITIRTTADTVGAALAQGGISLQGLDYSIPAELDPLPPNDQVQIVRVREEILLKQDQIPFTSEYQPADDLDLDQLQILTGGEYGLQAQRLRIQYENEQEVSRELEREWVIKEPSPRIIGYGTQVNLQTANTPDGQITYWRKITAYATSYDSTCPGCDTITSSGSVLKKGTIAVRLNWYRYMKGMRVYIP